jgi:SAM-dependent methyltransferase
MRLYSDLAPWWRVVSAVEHYEEEATQYLAMIRGAASRPVRDVLELGSGGGNNAWYLKAAFAMTLVEPSEGMRAQSREINPECEHLPGDMRTVRLGRTFDAVFVHDAVCYMATEADLRAAIETIAAHLAPGGVAVVAPDETIETFEPGTALHTGEDPATGRSVRYLAWSLPLAPGSTEHEVHYSLLLRDADGTMRAVHDAHRCGVFSRETWLRLFRDAGMTARIATRICEGVGYDTFVAVRDA